MIDLFLSEPSWDEDVDNGDSMKLRLSLLNELESTIWSLIVSGSRSEARLWLCNTIAGMTSITPRHQQTTDGGGSILAKRSHMILMMMYCRILILQVRSWICYQILEAGCFQLMGILQHGLIIDFTVEGTSEKLTVETAEMDRFAFLLLAISATLFPFFGIPFSAEPVDNLISQLLDTKFQIARLESILEENSRKLNERSLYLKECEKQIDEMSEKIYNLQSTLFSIKADSFHAEKRLKALEEEVQLLWATSRKNNFGLHILESKAQDAEQRLKEVTSVVEKMGDIVIEQWIQIQHLEQALHITEMRTMKARRLAGFTRCTFLKFFNSILDDFRAVQSYLFGDCSTANSLISQATDQMKRSFLLAKTYHHQLQAFIKDLMKRHKLTASFANDELVFFLASSLIIFPLMSAWILLSS